MGDLKRRDERRARLCGNLGWFLGYCTVASVTSAAIGAALATIENAPPFVAAVLAAFVAIILTVWLVGPPIER